MGFGYLFLGYLVSFVLYVTVNSLGVGGLALLLGYGLMLLGLWELTRYHVAFSYAKWTLLPMLVTAVYDLLNSFDSLFLWNLPFFDSVAEGIFNWIVFGLMIFFNLALLYGIRMIACDLEMPHMVTAAVRNSLFVGLYAVLYLIARFPIEPIEKISGYLILPVVLINIIWVVGNLLLLISCNKNICRAGDEEQPQQQSRFGWLNRMNEAYEKNRQRSVETTRRDAEDFLRRRNEKRELRDQKKKRKKK